MLGLDRWPTTMEMLTWSAPVIVVAGFTGVANPDRRPQLVRGAGVVALPVGMPWAPGLVAAPAATLLGRSQQVKGAVCQPHTDVLERGRPT